MDIRNTADINIPPYEKGNGLNQILKLQAELLSHYIGIEGLPQYPVNPHVKANQILLKDFIARITEEVGEGYESVLKGYEVLRSNMSPPKSDIEHPFFNLFEELSDAMHFYMELFLYLDITQDKVYGHFDEMDNPVERGLGCLENMYYHGYQLREAAMRDLGIRATPRWAYNNAVSFKSLELPPASFLVFLFSRDNTHKLYPRLAWDSTYYLQMARNTLKNKPWKQTEMLADSVLTEQNVIKSFIGFLGLCGLMGLDTENLYYLYYRKNHINLFRIGSNY